MPAVFSVWAWAPGTLTLAALPVPAYNNIAISSRANLDILLQVLDASGAVLATFNPTGRPPASLAASGQVAIATPGPVYVSLAGTGAGDPVTDGYSSYGSLGSFTCTVRLFAIQFGSLGRIGRLVCLSHPNHAPPLLLQMAYEAGSLPPPSPPPMSPPPPPASPPPTSPSPPPKRGGKP